jgi:hypothetical protein
MRRRACNEDMRTEPAFTESTSQPGDARGHVSTSTLASQLSGPLTALVGSAFSSGIIYGLIQFLERSPVRQEHVAGTAAWGQHLAVALASGTILSVAYARHRRRFGPRSGRLWLLAPLGQRAARRIADALGFGSGSALPVRALVALPAAATFLFCFWRAGAQVTGGLDPNFTVNAWGGPSYAGALACHYLDLFLTAAGAAWLIDRILPK